MTQLMYTQHPDMFQTTAQVTHVNRDAKGHYLVLNRSLFYPQGGGQPADQGTIDTAKACYAIFDVRYVHGEVRHYTIDNTIPIYHTGHATINIDRERRTLNSKYHTAGHLIASIVERENPEIKAIKGHQFPGEAYIEFDGTVGDLDHFITQVQSQAFAHISSNSSVKTEEANIDDAAKILQDPSYQPLRVCRILGFPPTPCGGTHVKTLRDLSSLVINRCKNKKGKLRIYYEVA